MFILPYLKDPKRAQSAIRKGVDRLRNQFEVEDNFRSLETINSTSCIVNEKEIRIVGLRRSGNHAVINWIRKQQAGETFYINNVRLKENPFRAVYQDQIRKSKNPSLPGWRTEDIDRWQREAEGEFSIKKCLLYSYEDQPIDQLSDRNFDKKHDLYFGKSKARYDLIIMRDPFNLFASRLRANQKSEALPDQFDFMRVKSRKSSLPQMWIDYAQEYLNETNYLQHTKVPVNYNLWSTDPDYRCQIAEKLDLDFTDAGFDDVMTNGGGSSFDGIALNGKASEMSVLERWKHFAEDPRFRALIDDERLLDYSTKIFGAIPSLNDFQV